MANRLRNIVLIGMPGAGKSTVGATLAELLGYTLIDTDRMLEDTYGKKLASLVAELGVARFLKAEGRVGETLDCVHCVIATGGSMVYSEGAMHCLRALGVTVWLEAPTDELRQRISAESDRGIAAGQDVTIDQLDAERRPLYEKYADVRVSSTGTKEAVAAQIIKAVQALENSTPPNEQ